MTPQGSRVWFVYAYCLLWFVAPALDIIGRLVAVPLQASKYPVMWTGKYTSMVWLCGVVPFLAKKQESQPGSKRLLQRSKPGLIPL